MRKRRQRTLAVSLEALLREGHWGQLRPGMSRQLVVQRLGAPPRWQRSTAELRALRAGTPIAGWALSEVLHYDGIEFHFTDALSSPCIRIFCDDLDALGAGRALTVDPWWLREGMTESAVVAALSAAGLPAQRRPFPLAPRQRRLLLPSGARLGLTDDPAFFAPGTAPEGHCLFCVEVGGSA